MYIYIYIYICICVYIIQILWFEGLPPLAGERRLRGRGSLARPACLLSGYWHRQVYRYICWLQANVWQMLFSLSLAVLEKPLNEWAALGTSDLRRFVSKSDQLHRSASSTQAWYIQKTEVRATVLEHADSKPVPSERYKNMFEKTRGGERRREKSREEQRSKGRARQHETPYSSKR